MPGSVEDHRPAGTAVGGRWGKPDLIHAVALVCLFLGLGVHVDFAGDFAINDDWAYATPVLWWVESGDLRLTFWQSMPLVTQFALAAVWSQIVGASHEDLRALSLLCSAVSSLVVYAFMRGLDFPRLACSALALLLPASPVFLGLSFTFMTDVPGALLVLVSTMFFAAAMSATQGMRRAAFACGLVTMVLAVLLRQTSVAIPIGLLLTAIAARRPSGTGILPAGAALCLAGVALVGARHLLEQTSGVPALYDAKSHDLAEWLRDAGTLRLGALLRPVDVFLYFLIYFGAFCLPALPLVLSLEQGRERWRAVLAGLGIGIVILIAALAFGRSGLPGTVGDILMPDGMGPRLIQGVAGGPGMVSLPATVVFAGVAGCVLWVLGRQCVVGSGSGAPGRAQGMFVLLVGLIIAVPHAVSYGPLFDRYTVLPSLLVLVGGLAMSDRRAIPRLAAMTSAGLALVFILFGAHLTNAFFVWQTARYDLIATAGALYGAAPEAIDGGFEYNNLVMISAQPDAAIAMTLADAEGRAFRITAVPIAGLEPLRTVRVASGLGLGDSTLHLYHLKP